MKPALVTNLSRCLFLPLASVHAINLELFIHVFFCACFSDKVKSGVTDTPAFQLMSRFEKLASGAIAPTGVGAERAMRDCQAFCSMLDGRRRHEVSFTHLVNLTEKERNW